MHKWEAVKECLKENFFSQSFFSDMYGCLKRKGLNNEEATEIIRELLDSKELAYKWAKIWGRASAEDPEKLVEEHLKELEKYFELRERR